MTTSMFRPNGFRIAYRIGSGDPQYTDPMSRRVAENYIEKQRQRWSVPCETRSLDGDFWAFVAEYVSHQGRFFAASFAIEEVKP